jgi:DNA-directed RNA polymerase specialized sigma24 family protein
MKTPLERVKDYINTTGQRDEQRIRSAMKRTKEGSVPIATIRAALAGQPAPEGKPAPPAPAGKSAPQESKLRAFSLSSLRVSDRRPSDGLKAKFFKLRKGVGVAVDDLADEWGVSSETVRNHGRRLNCLLYVEVSPGEWIHCATHPDTAGEKLS